MLNVYEPLLSFLMLWSQIITVDGAFLFMLSSVTDVGVGAMPVLLAENMRLLCAHTGEQIMENMNVNLSKAFAVCFLIMMVGVLFTGQN